MGRVPRGAWFSAGQPIVVPQHRRAGTAAGPVLTGHLRSPAFGCRSGQDVMPVWRAGRINGPALLVQCGVVVDIRLVRVQVRQSLRDEHALDVVPGTGADAISSVHTAGPGCAEVGAPGPISRPRD